MAKSKAKGAYRGGNQSKKGSQEDPMAFKRASRVNKITSAQDAGFEGQDAFGLGDDEVNLNGRRTEDDGKALHHTLLSMPLPHTTTMLLAATPSLRS
jgi:hypothetical protein